MRRILLEGRWNARLVRLLLEMRAMWLMRLTTVTTRSTTVRLVEGTRSRFISVVRAMVGGGWGLRVGRMLLLVR